MSSREISIDKGGKKETEAGKPQIAAPLAQCSTPAVRISVVPTDPSSKWARNASKPGLDDVMSDSARLSSMEVVNTSKQQPAASKTADPPQLSLLESRNQYTQEKRQRTMKIRKLERAEIIEWDHKPLPSREEDATPSEKLYYEDVVDVPAYNAVASSSRLTIRSSSPTSPSLSPSTIPRPLKTFGTVEDFISRLLGAASLAKETSDHKESSRNARLLERLSKPFILPGGHISFEPDIDNRGSNQWEENDIPPDDFVSIAIVCRHSRTPNPFTAFDVQTSLSYLQNVGLSFGHFVIGLDITRIRVFTYIQIAGAVVPIDHWDRLPQNANIPPEHRGTTYYGIRDIFHHTLWLSSSAVGVNLRRYFFVPAPIRLRGGMGHTGRIGEKKKGSGGMGDMRKIGMPQAKKKEEKQDGKNNERPYDLVFPEKAMIHVIMIIPEQTATKFVSFDARQMAEDYLEFTLSLEESTKEDEDSSMFKSLLERLTKDQARVFQDMRAVEASRTALSNGQSRAMRDALAAGRRESDFSWTRGNFFERLGSGKQGQSTSDRTDVEINLDQQYLDTYTYAPGDKVGVVCYCCLKVLLGPKSEGYAILKLPSAANDRILHKVRHLLPLPIQGVETLIIGHDCAAMKLGSGSGDGDRSGVESGSKSANVETGSTAFESSRKVVKQLEELLKEYKEILAYFKYDERLALGVCKPILILWYLSLGEKDVIVGCKAAAVSFREFVSRIRLKKHPLHPIWDGVMHLSASSTIGWSRALARSFGDTAWSKEAPPGHIPTANDGKWLYGGKFDSIISYSKNFGVVAGADATESGALGKGKQK